MIEYRNKVACSKNVNGLCVGESQKSLEDRGVADVAKIGQGL